jgi:hypothetical protein
MIYYQKEMDINPDTHFRSNATSWEELADDIVGAIENLKALNKKGSSRRFILVAVSTDFRTLTLGWCDRRGKLTNQTKRNIHLHIPALPDESGKQREDGVKSPHGTIDRAINKAAKLLISWTIDPDSCELLKHVRYRLMISWTQDTVTEASPWVFGMFE